MDTILTDSHIDTRIESYILMNVIVVEKLKYIYMRETYREREVRNTVS